MSTRTWIGAMALALSACGGGGAADPTPDAGSGGFRFSSTTTSCGRHPLSVAVGDVDGDGAPDLVARNAGDDSVTVFRGDPEAPGAFGCGDQVLVHREARCIALGDLDGDGCPDLVVGHTNPGGVEVHLQRPDARGTFRSFPPPARFSLGAAVDAVCVADLDGDGALDVAVLDAATGVVSVGHGDRLGGVVPGGSVLTDALGGRRLVAADLDRDGRLDLLAGGADGVAIVRDGSGGLDVENVDVGFAVADVAVADFDGDGWLDAAVLGNHPNVVRFVGAVASSALRTITDPLDDDADADGIQCVAGDFDKDGRPDLLVTSRVQGLHRQQIVHRDVAARRSMPDVATPLPGTGNDLGAEVGDLDGDGTLDWAACSPGTDEVVVHLQRRRPVGALSFRRVATIPTTGTPGDLGIVDVDRDGYPDLVANDAGTAQIRTWRRVAPGEPGLTFLEDTATTGADGSSVVVEADLDGDGLTDLVTLDPDLRDVLLHRGSDVGPVRWMAPEALLPRSAGTGLAVGDLDRNGRLDVVVCRDTTPGTWAVLWQESDGSFTPAFHGASSLAAEAGPLSAVATADVDGDGIPDVALHDGRRGELIVFLSHPALPRSFRESRAYGLGRPSTVARKSGSIVYLDREGNEVSRLCVGDDLGLAVSPEDGTHPGGFAPSFRVQAATGAARCVAADVDADGDTDACAVGGADAPAPSAGAFWVFESRPDETDGFAPRSVPLEGVPLDEPILDLAVGDLDGDGLPDLVVCVRSGVATGAGAAAGAALLVYLQDGAPSSP